MIEFLTLFLGLAHGVQSVDLRVSPSVAAVEVRLDGLTVGRLGHPPWSVRCDFGPEPMPRELVAIARGATGQEIARARQWINAGSLDEDKTPVVIDLGAADQPPDLSEISSWLTVGGQPAEVLAVERGPAEVVMVRDPAPESCLGPVARLFLERQLGRTEYVSESREGWSHEGLLDNEEAFLEAGRRGFRSPSEGGAAWVPVPGQLREARSSLQSFLTLGEGDRLRFLSPRAAPVARTSGTMNIFNTSIVFSAERQGFLALVDQAPALGFAARFTDAVAVAGLELHSAGVRRAVVLLVDGRAGDGSSLRPEQVRRYLQTLQVPVLVWSFEGEEPLEAWNGGVQIATPEATRRAAAETACVVDSRGLAAFEAAGQELRQVLERQRIVWLRGRHLPSAVALSDAATVRLAGRLVSGRAEARGGAR